MAGRVVILMGSKGDLDHAKKIAAELDAFGVYHTLRIASAHKSVHHLLQILESYRESGEPAVFITIAGRSNALAGLVDANTPWPVITCPPISSTFAEADVFSSLRMPSGVAPLVILDPANAALAAAKILAMRDASLRSRISAYQEKVTAGIIEADHSLSESWT